jgi:hypothetical protein
MDHWKARVRIEAELMATPGYRAASEDDLAHLFAMEGPLATHHTAIIWPSVVFRRYVLLRGPGSQYEEVPLETFTPTMAGERVRVIHELRLLCAVVTPSRPTPPPPAS